MWLAKEYAQLCAIKEWEGYEPASIPLDGLMDELLPKLKKAGVTPTVGVFLAHLNEELRKY